MRALDYVPNPGFELTAFSDTIAQHPFEAPSVFSYFQDDHKPNGAVGNAGLISPEASMLTAPNIVDFVNGLQSTVQYGFSRCSNGLALQLASSCSLLYRTP